MRPHKPTLQLHPRKSSLLLVVAVSAMSVAGCATSPGHRQSYSAASAPMPRSENSAATSVSSESPSRGATRPLQPGKIRTVGYSEELAIEGSSVPEVAADDERQEPKNDIAPGKNDSTKISDSADEHSIPPTLQTESLAGTQQPVDYFVQVALGNHPKIRAARQRVGAAYNVVPQVTSLPDPMFNNTFWPIQDQALQTAAGRMAHQFSLQQGVPWPEKLRTKGAIATQEVQMAQAEVDRIEREITEAVRLAYFELWFATRAITIVEETRELVDDLTQVAEASYKSGGSQQDVLRAQLETDRLDDQLVTLTKQKEFAQADLAALVQQPVSLIPEATQEIGLANVPEQLDGLLELAEQCSPELRAIAWEIQRDRQKQKLACLQKYPDFNLGLNYGIISDGGNVVSPVANGNDNISFTVGVTLPVWRDKINGGIDEAAHRTSSSTQRLQAERDVLYGKLRRLMAQADALTEQRGIYNTRIIPRTEDTLKLAVADYRGKRTDFFSLIETYRELLMYETQLARIDATLAGTVAQIERTVGCPPQ
jgi:cobalt-zinc-cadmium efflux system outer membrane protein